MKRIAIFLPSLRGGGAQRVVVDVANGLVRRGLEMELVLASGEGVYQSLLDEGVRVVDMGAGRVYRSIVPLIRYLRCSKPDVLLAVQRHAVIIAWLARWFSGWDGRLVARETNSFREVPGRHVGWRDTVLAFLVKRIYRYMDCVIVPSRGVASDLQHLPHVVTIPNPVSLPPDSERIEREHPFVLAAGSLDRQKRFDDLMTAFGRLVTEHDVPDLELVILGEGPERSRLLAIAEQLGIADRVDMPGFVVDPFRYMRSASVLVLSSGWEGLPNVLIQAMACGAPIVATDCPHGPREILADGRYGELVPVGDVAALAAAIGRQLDQGRQPYPPEALAPYDYDRVVDAYELVLTGRVSRLND